MIINIIGGGEREESCAELLRSARLPEFVGRVTVLPIPSTRDKITVNGTGVLLEELAAESECGTLFCAYSPPPSFFERVEARGGFVADVAEDEEFLSENARLTAECTLSYIMSHSALAVSDLEIAVVGYGRIGRVLLELLLFHGARVTVCTRSPATHAMLVSNGVSALLDAEAQFCGFDLIVNTAPAQLFSRAQLKTLGCEVIELAPGENFPQVEKVTRLPSLPAKMLPKSSGMVYGRAVLRALNNMEKSK